MTNPIFSTLKLATLALSTAALVACGGGGGELEIGGSSDLPSAPTLASAQGFWSDTTSVSAVILPSGQVWVIYQNGNSVSALAQGTLSLSGTTYTGIGQHYTLPGGAVNAFSLSATLGPETSYTDKATTLVNTATVGTGTPSTQTWVYNKTYENPATQSSVQGHWSGLQGAVSLVWDIDAAGKIVGTSTTGCTYSGSLTPNANPVAVLDAAITESCAGTLKTLNGIALLNTAKTGLSLAYTTQAGSQGGVLLLQK
jgi:hypothetical protein